MRTVNEQALAKLSTLCRGGTSQEPYGKRQYSDHFAEGKKVYYFGNE